LLGANEISLDGHRESVDNYPSPFDRFAYGDLIELSGLGALTIVSRLSPAGLPALARDTDLNQEALYLRLFTPAERYWYEESWQRQGEAASTALRAEQRTAAQSLFRAVSRGARVVTGSDAPDVPWGLGLHAELQLLAGTGLQPFQVLRMATLDAAEALGLGKQQGRIAAGMRADLVLVDGDPLRNVAEARKIVATISRGRVFSSETLLRSPIVEDSYAQPTPNPAFP
jgi:hypothetical protein